MLFARGTNKQNKIKQITTTLRIFYTDKESIGLRHSAIHFLPYLDTYQVEWLNLKALEAKTI